MQPLAGQVEFSPWEPGLLGLAVYVALVVGLIVVLLVLAAWLGERRPSVDKLLPYESGIIPTGSARLRQPVPFFLVAILFLIFDVEAAFIFAWAVAWDGLGWAGWLQLTLFVAILVLGLLYEWKKGGLEWGPSAKKPGSASG